MRESVAQWVRDLRQDDLARQERLDALRGALADPS